jgi:hypothetical protein
LTLLHFSSSFNVHGLCDVVVQGLNHSGTTGGSSITVEAALAIMRSLSRSCGKEFSFSLEKDSPGSSVFETDRLASVFFASDPRFLITLTPASHQEKPPHAVVRN